MPAVRVQKVPAAREALAAHAEAAQQHPAALAVLAASGGACSTGLRASRAAQQAEVAWACHRPALVLAAWARAGAARRATELAAPEALVLRALCVHLAGAAAVRLLWSDHATYVELQWFSLLPMSSGVSAYPLQRYRPAPPVLRLGAGAAHWPRPGDLRPIRRPKIHLRCQRRPARTYPQSLPLWLAE